MINEFELIISEKLTKLKFEKVALYPYGNIGTEVKRILNTEYNIQDIRIFDNQKEDCLSLEELRVNPLEDKECILITSNSRELFDVIRTNVYEVVSDKGKVIDLFPEAGTNYAKKKAIEYGMEKNNYIYSLKNKNSKFYLPYVIEDYIQNWIFSYDAYFEESLLNYIVNIFDNGGVKKKNGIILDIGANIGNHALYYVLESGFKEVWSFEPTEDTFSILVKNVEINNIENNVKLYPYAVGDVHGKAEIVNYRKSNIGGTSIRYEEEGKIEVIAVDELNIADEIKMIKVDVEGFEVNVIKGALSTIKKNLPYISIEICNEKNFKEIQSMLVPLGYQFEQLTKEDFIFKHDNQIS